MGTIARLPVLLRSLALAVCGALVPANAGADCQGGRFVLSPADVAHLPAPLTAIDIDAAKNIVSLALGAGQQVPMCISSKASMTQTKNGLLVHARWDSCQKAGAFSLQGLVDAATCGTFAGDITGSRPGIRTPVTAITTQAESVRFLTYNVQMVPSQFLATTTSRRAEQIADRILAGGYDFLALNEAFDEDIRRILLRRLRDTFPYFVAALGSPQPILEDSGLMLFSRFPFVELPNTEFQACVDDGIGERCHRATGSPNYCHGSDCTKVAFFGYQDCETPDCLAEKGVGFVRLMNPATMRIYNVAFTQMQAAYPLNVDSGDDARDHVDTRRRQLATIERVIDVTLGTARDREEVMILGDINVDGNLANKNLGIDRLNEPNLFEWVETLGPGSSIGSRYADSWATDNAPPSDGDFDRGLTNAFHWGPGFDGARLDFVLRKHASSLCVQHMTLARNLWWSPPEGPWIEGALGPSGIGLIGTTQTSDHVGVNVDVNAPAPLCNPAAAREIDFSASSLVLEDGTLTYPGSMQWFRINDPGTYSIEVISTNGTDFRVYEGDDLTTPVSQFKGLVGPVLKQGQTFRIDSSPFYIRVFNGDRSRNGPYRLAIRRHDCSQKALACALAPAQTLHHRLPVTPPLGLPDEAWFVLQPERAPSFQNVDFEVAAIPAAARGAFTLEVYAGDGATLLARGREISHPDGSSSLVLGRETLGGDRTYLVVKRFAPPSEPPAPPYPAAVTSYDVSWFTNLTILYGAARGGSPLNLECYEENDGPFDDGDDEMYFDAFSIDVTTIAIGRRIGDFDAASVRSLDSLMFSAAGSDTIAFFYQVQFQLRERDGGAFLDDDFFPMTLFALPPRVQERSGVLRFVEVPAGSGVYGLTYQLTHGFDRE